MLIFLGLVTAAAASVLAAADKVVAPVLMRWFLGGSATFALIAGILVLAMVTEAHNHARIGEKSGQETEELKSARRKAANYGTWVNVAAVVAAVFLVIGLAIFIFSPAAPTPTPAPATAPASRVDVTVTQTCSPVIQQPQPEPFCK